jgi:hypothetical protein
MITHPLPVGTRVRHIAQEWARTSTATITAVDGPFLGENYDYTVLATRFFADAPGPDNPETRITQWSSRATVPTEESPR